MHRVLKGLQTIRDDEAGDISGDDDPDHGWIGELPDQEAGAYDQTNKEVGAVIVNDNAIMCNASSADHYSKSSNESEWNSSEPSGVSQQTDSSTKLRPAALHVLNEIGRNKRRF